jgi:starch-binding outer membrane protein SusE/F
MKSILKIFILTTLVFGYGCKKYSFDNESKGEALGDFKLVSPTSGTSLALNPATPNAPVVITWTASKPGVSKEATYKWVAALKTGNIDAPILELPADNGGKDTKISLTHQAIDAALASKGVAANATAELIWSVVADNGSVKVRATEVRAITIKRNTDGLTSFLLLGPSSSTTNIEINPTSTTDIITMNWTKTKPAVVANVVKYKVLFVQEGGNFNTPLMTINSDNSGVDSTLKISWKVLSDSLTAKGLTDLSQVAKLEWTVVATSGTFTMRSDVVNKLYVARLVRMFIVGSFTGWDINTAPEVIADKANGRLAKVFYTYVKLNAGDAFKFAKIRGDWGSAYGNTGSAGAGEFTTGYNQGGDFSVTASGVYRITLDLNANKVYIQQKQVGLVGSLQGWNPASGLTGGLLENNRFLIIAPVVPSDEFKFHDGPVWDNGAPNLARWWGKGTTAGTLDTDGNGANVNNTVGTGRVRAIWDGRDPQSVKYDLTSANEMRVVGNGINQTGVNDWDPPTSPQMTYSGNGIWTISITLKAAKEIKFVAGNAWGAFDYEDAGGGKIKDEGGPNFNTPPVAGVYTITLNEYTRTITIL